MSPGLCRCSLPLSLRCVDLFGFHLRQFLFLLGSKVILQLQVQGDPYTSNLNEIESEHLFLWFSKSPGIKSG